MKNTDKSAAPGVAATPTESGASPEGNDGEPGAVESIPTEPRNGGVQGDERIRTAVTRCSGFSPYESAAPTVTNRPRLPITQERPRDAGTSGAAT